MTTPQAAAWRRGLIFSVGLSISLLTAASSSFAEITIASIAPWSALRPYAALGSLRGTELMVESLNKAGGLLGQKLRIVQIDDGCDAEQARIAVKLAIESHPALVMGGACSPAAAYVTQQLAASGILQIMPNAPTQSLTELGIPTIFRMTGRGDREGAFTASLIMKNWPDRRVAILDDGEANWHEAASSVAATLQEHGITPALTAQFAINQPNYTSLIDEIRAKQIGLLYLSGLPPDIGVIAHEIVASGLSIPMLAGRNGVVGAFRQTAGDAAEGILSPERRDWRSTALADPLLAAEQAKGEEINIFIVDAYASIQVWSAAATAAGTFDATAVAAAMKSKHFSTVIGDLAFDEKGDLTAETEDWVWYRWQGGMPVMQ